MNSINGRARLLRSIMAAASLTAFAPLMTGAALAADTPADAPAAAPDDEPAIVVTGQRAAELRAIQLKEKSNAVTETLVADDVGKLPDQNVAEAVKRLPGLSVANDQGEGRYVIIRGVDPNLVNVTVNGMTQPAPEPEGRQVKLDDIPSSLISAVTISKSLTADQDANAIGGAVDIRTLSAFDKKEHFFIAGRAQVGRYDLNRKHPYEGDAQIGGRFGANHDFGAVLSVSYSKRPIESENLQGEDVDLQRAQPTQLGLRDYNLVRKRTGVVLNLDYQPSSAVKIFLRGTYSKFSDNERRDQNRLDSINWGSATAVTGNFTARPIILIRRREEDDNTKSISGGGSFLVGSGHLDVTGSWARAIKNDPLRSEFNFRGTATGANSVAGTFDLTGFDASGELPLIAFTTPFATTYALNSVNYDHRHAQEDLWQLRADYTVPVEIGDGSTIKIGAKYLNRHKTNNRDYQAYSLASGQTFPVSVASYVDDTNFYDGTYVFGPRINYDAAQAYITAHPTVIAQTNANIVTSKNNSLVNDYDVREKISAGYAMATLKFGQVTIIPGVRVEHTEDGTLAKVITASSTFDQGLNTSGSKSYTNVFPGVNLKFEPVDNLIFRAAATASIARPGYATLAPFISVDATTSPNTISEGNSALKPYKAINLDAALEYYLPNKGLISIGVFYKDIKDPIYSGSTSVTNATIGGQLFTAATVVQPFNATKATVYGIELNVQYQFAFLPAPLDGFGVSGNITFVGGHGEASFRTDDLPLINQSKKVGSAQLYYEKYGITARLAYSYRSPYMDVLSSSGPKLDQYTDKNGQLDARIGYAITPNFTVYAEGVNLTDTPWRRYLGSSQYLVEREHYGPLYRAGVQIRF